MPVAVALLVLLPLAALLARPLRMLELGDDAAGALGVASSARGLALIVVGVALTAVGVAVGGPDRVRRAGRAADRAPADARRRPRLGCAALMGAVLLVGADFAAQRLFGDHAAARRRDDRRCSAAST